jgi:hypothetical protein
MGKTNFCRLKTEYACTADRDSDCKFFAPYAVGGCKHKRVRKCINTKAWKHAKELATQEEYSKRKVTA